MIPFDSRKKEYKSVFGSIAAGENLRLKVLLPIELKASGVYFAYYNDSDKIIKYINMNKVADAEGTEQWVCDFSAGEGLYFYYFEYDSFGVRQKITLKSDGTGQFYENGSHWQLTVYDKDFKVPMWPAGGIIYQIFPDRFFSSGLKKDNVPDDRYMVQNWADSPVFESGNGGRVLNNDYFGGDLNGIEQKLDYLKELGVTCIYLNPIFEAHSNHRYNTADYLKIDPLLGTEADFKSLCKAAGEKGIKIIIDGVFSHTGSDSLYFNKENRYENDGAYNSEASPFYSWYKFNNWPHDYTAWWGIKTLPEVNEEDESFCKFITGKDGVMQKWLNAGAAGWRLDVADELPDGFLDKIRTSVKDANPDALILGEVWENASNKISYGSRRRFIRGKQLDSVMNYPFYNAVLEYLKGGSPSDFHNEIISVLETYPPQVINVLMNHLGTHDTKRILTALAGESEAGYGREWQSRQKSSDKQRVKGIKLLKLASLIQYTLPGIPSLYYGDEAGLEGYRDPFNRGTFPWGNENKELTEWYKDLGKLRHSCPALIDGEYIPTYSENDFLTYIRKKGNDEIFIAVNRGDKPVNLWLLPGWKDDIVLIGEKPTDNFLRLPPLSAAVMGRGEWAKYKYK